MFQALQNKVSHIFLVMVEMRFLLGEVCPFCFEECNKIALSINCLLEKDSFDVAQTDGNKDLAASYENLVWNAVSEPPIL